MSKQVVLALLRTPGQITLHGMQGISCKVQARRARDTEWGKAEDVPVVDGKVDLKYCSPLAHCGYVVRVVAGERP